MAEEIDFENGHIWQLVAERQSSWSRDGHVSRDARDLVVGHNSTLIALSSDTSALSLRLFVVE